MDQESFLRELIRLVSFEVDLNDNFRYLLEGWYVELTSIFLCLFTSKVFPEKIVKPGTMCPCGETVCLHTSHGRV